jgi:hypothetical protein
MKSSSTDEGLGVLRLWDFPPNCSVVLRSLVRDEVNILHVESHGQGIVGFFGGASYRHLYFILAIVSSLSGKSLLAETEGLFAPLSSLCCLAELQRV